MTKLAKVDTTGGVLTRAQQQRLIKDVRALLDAGRDAAHRVIEQVALRTYWQVGQRVLRESLTERAGYRNAVLAEIAREVSVDLRTLQAAVQFARLYPNEPQGTLNWSQYRELIRLKDDKERAYYEQHATTNGWSKRELTAAIQTNAYGLVLERGGRPSARGSAKTKAGSEPSASPTPSLERPTEADYLYEVEPLRVIDGDTIDVQVDLGFEVLRRYRLRLSGVDAPERKTPEGQEASRYVVERLASATFVVVETLRVDLHGRYVAHVFYTTRTSDNPSKSDVYKNGHYLNEELVQQGLATVVTTR